MSNNQLPSTGTLIPGAPTTTGTYFAVIRSYFTDEDQMVVLHYLAHKGTYRASGHAFNIEVKAEDIIGYIGQIESEASGKVLPTFWDIAKAFKWAAEYRDEIGGHLTLFNDQWTLISEDEDGNENETQDLTSGNVAELYCLQKGFTPSLTQECADLIHEVNNRDLNGIGYYRHEEVAALKAKGDKLALALRRLAGSVSVHPDYGKGQPNEFFDRVDGAHQALAEWSGEKEVISETKYYTDDELRDIISMVCDQLNEGFDGREEFIDQTVAVFAGRKAAIEELRKLGVKHPNPHLCDNKNNCGYPGCECLPF